MTTLTGHAAIEYASRNNCTLSKYADPIEDAMDGLTIAEARRIAQEDPSLIWVEQDESCCPTCGHPVNSSGEFYGCDDPAHLI